MRDITIVSGGQTGADRAALDFAIEFGLAHGGWCPRGRLAEDGPIDERYATHRNAVAPLQPADRVERPRQRRDGRVQHSARSDGRHGADARARPSGSASRVCIWRAKTRLGDRQPTRPTSCSAFLAEHHVARLNVAGPAGVAGAAGGRVCPQRARRGARPQRDQPSNLSAMKLEISPGKTRIGWIGTGVMGRSMCGHLLAAGYHGDGLQSHEGEGRRAGRARRALGRFAARRGRRVRRRLLRSSAIRTTSAR